MKKLLVNLRPVAAYWLSVLICFIAYFAADFDFITNLNRNQLSTVFFYISLAVGFILVGRITDLKNVRQAVL